MNHNTLLVDIDGVLADYVDGLRRFIESSYDVRLPDGDPMDYGFTDWPLPESWSTVHHAAVADGLYARLKPMGGAREAIRRLRGHGWRVVAATSRTEPPLFHTTGLTASWLDYALDRLDGLTFGVKDLTDGDVLVDDDPRALDAWAARHPQGRTLLYDHLYNRDDTTHGRVTGWDGVLKTLEEKR